MAAMQESEKERREEEKIIGKAIAEAWESRTFREDLIANATEILRKRGVTIPTGVRIKVVEDTEQLKHLVLPIQPPGPRSPPPIVCSKGIVCSI